MNPVSEHASRLGVGRLRASHGPLWLVVALTAACGTDEPGPLVPPVAADAPFRAIVSDPATSASGTVTLLGAPAAADGAQVVYVSLPPGSTDEGTDLEVRNRASSYSELIPILDGGFDPVPIPGSAGDTLDFVLLQQALELASWAEAVPARGVPDIVRTEPPKGKRDVPVALRILVVFSEPMDGATLNAETIRLLRGGIAEPGSVAVTPDGLGATFTPDDELAAGTEYVLSISDAASDLDGDNLEAPVEVEFTTAGSAEEPPPPGVITVMKVSGHDQADTVGATLPQPLVVRVLDGGVPVAGVQVQWEAPWVVNQPGVYPTFFTGSHVATTVTGADGLATMEVRLGTGAGSWPIRASGPWSEGSPSPSVELWVTSLAGSPTRLEWLVDPYLLYAPDPRGPSWMKYPTYDVTITGVSFTTPISAAAVDVHGNPRAVPIEWSVLSGGVVLTPLYTNGVLNTGAVMSTPQADGPHVVQAASPGLSAITDTIYSAATIILTLGSGDGHCEEGSFVPSAASIPVGRSVAWSICDQDGTDGWLYENGEWSWTYEHNVTFEDGVVVWPSTTEDWHPHLRAFTAPGTYRYRCTLHSTGYDDTRGEVGVVIVQ